MLAVTRDGAWEEWLIYILRGVEDTAQWTRVKIDAIQALAAHTMEYVRDRQPKICSRELVDVIFEQPYCRISNLAEAGIAKRQAGSRYLKHLVEIGVLREQKVGRERLFIHPKLMELLTLDSNEFEPYP